jgi:hypothetical protein
LIFPVSKWLIFWRMLAWAAGGGKPDLAAAQPLDRGCGAA